MKKSNPHKISEQELWDYVRLDPNDIATNKKYSPPNVPGETYINDIASEALTCLKICQKQRPLIAEHRKQHEPELDQAFVNEFTKQLIKLEDSFFQIAPCMKTTPVRMTEDYIGDDPDSIPIYVSDSEVVLRMQYLPARNVTKTMLYTELLAAKLSSAGLPKWRRWHADICQVYPSDKIHMARDVDNSDYKALIDTIALFLHTTDAASYFSMSADVIADDELQPGTYVRITPKPEIDPAVEAWKNAQKVRNSPP